MSSFMKWYANLYFHIPPSFSSVLLMPMSNQASCLGNALQALASRHCGMAHDVWATADSQSQATMKCSSPLSSFTTSPLRPRFRAGAHCGLEVFSTPERAMSLLIATARSKASCQLSASCAGTQVPCARMMNFVSGRLPQCRQEPLLACRLRVKSILGIIWLVQHRGQATGHLGRQRFACQGAREVRAYCQMHRGNAGQSNLICCQATGRKPNFYSGLESAAYSRATPERFRSLARRSRFP